jgi:nitrogen fixation protein NifU and related proteins
LCLFGKRLSIFGERAKRKGRRFLPTCKHRGLHAAYNMDRQEAIEFLLDHYENPRNKGSIEHPNVSLSGGNPGCADLITMQARFGEDGKLEAISWDGQGCSISCAAASYVTSIVEGLTPEEIEAMSFEDLVEQLGKELVMTRPTCATLALGTLKKGVHEYHMHKLAKNTHYH